jgi:hypothetical protein
MVNAPSSKDGTHSSLWVRLPPAPTILIQVNYETGEMATLGRTTDQVHASLAQWQSAAFVLRRASVRFRWEALGWL